MPGASIPVGGAARLLDVPEQEVRGLADAGSRWSSLARRWALVQPSEN